jgi:NADPH-dependent 2,4-dienoyl-CoA reductase/sulfur reductase-like enzyme
MKLVIIGADAAGMSAASRAKRKRADIDVTVLEKTNDVSYSACGMPYNIADPKRQIDDLVVRPAQVFRDKQGINLLTNHQVEAIDPANKKVSGINSQGHFELTYNKLLIATGGTPIVPDLPGFDLRGVFSLKSLDHGRKIKSYIQDNNVKKVVIIGMGYIALEMCEALRARKIEVELIKPNPIFLPWLPEEMSIIIKNELEAQGITLHLGQAVEKIEKRGDHLAVVSQDLILEADLVLVAMGITPNSQLAARAGLDLGPANAIAVDRRLQTSDSNIYAAGDCADAFHVVSGQKTWIPLALRANRAGWAAADNICGQALELAGVAGTAVFKVFDLQVARTGILEEDTPRLGFDPVGVVIKSPSRAHAHPGGSTIWVKLLADEKSGRLLGAQMVGREGVAHRINAAAVALHAQMTVAQFSQADLAYAPPFGPVWDPLLTASNQLLKQINSD